MKVFAITGDIVLSTQMDSKKLLGINQKLTQQFETLGEKSLFKASKNYMFYRGDSFQFISSKIDQCFDMALKLRLIAKAEESDLRLSIGLGLLEGTSNMINSSTGSAVIYSGRGMENMDQQRLLFSSKNHELDKQINLYFLFADAILENMTPRMSQILLLMLTGLNQKEITTELGITQSAISQSLKSAQAHTLLALHDYFPNLLSQRE